jgi:hypothetical protein
MEAISSLLGTACSTRYKYRGKDMILPKFMHGEVLNKLEQKKPHTSAEIALLSKLRKMKNVSTQSMIQFMRNKQCDLPEIYYYFKLKSKTIYSVKEETYTLFVHSPLHRFDSAGIISKNSCADIMKTVMVRVSNWIKANHLEDEIKLLLTMHDELVFEMPEDKLAQYIPPINNIMCLKDILQGPVLNWPVPLTVDAEYGDSWHVTNDFFKEHPELKNTSDQIEFHSVEHIAFPAPAPVEKKTEEKPIDPITESVLEEHKSPEKIEEKPAEKTLTDQPIESVSTEDEKELVYVIQKTTRSTSRKFNDIVQFLTGEMDESECCSPKKVLRLYTKDGQNLLMENVKVHSESFSALIQFLGL